MRFCKESVRVIHHDCLKFPELLILYLCDRLITAASLVSLAVGEEPVDDYSNNWEDEDEQTPQELV